MFENEVSWMFISGGFILSMFMYSVGAEKIAKAEAKAKVSIEAIKAGLVQSPEGFWVKPE